MILNRLFNIITLILSGNFNYNLHRLVWNHLEDCKLYINRYGVSRVTVSKVHQKVYSIEVDINSEHIVTDILHEIGHKIDYEKEGFLKFHRHNDRRLEKKAWKYALELSKEYNLPLNKSLAKQYLYTYGYNYRRLEK